MTSRNALLDRLANSSLGLNKGIAVLFGLAVLLTGTSYWAVQRVIKEQRDSVEFHFARLMENIREHEAFLTTVSRESAKGRLLESLHEPLYVQDSPADEGSNVYIGREHSFSLPFSIKVNAATIPALQHSKITALGAHLANYYSAYWSASHYQSPQIFVANVPANFEISVPAAGRLRDGGHNLAGELSLVMQQILARHYDNIQPFAEDQVH